MKEREIRGEKSLDLCRKKGATSIFRKDFDQEKRGEATRLRKNKEGEAWGKVSSITARGEKQHDWSVGKVGNARAGEGKKINHYKEKLTLSLSWTFPSPHSQRGELSWLGGKKGGGGIMI